MSLHPLGSSFDIFHRVGKKGEVIIRFFIYFCWFLSFLSRFPFIPFPFSKKFSHYLLAKYWHESHYEVSQRLPFSPFPLSLPFVSCPSTVLLSPTFPIFPHLSSLPMFFLSHLPGLSPPLSLPSISSFLLLPYLHFLFFLSTNLSFSLPSFLPLSLSSSPTWKRGKRAEKERGRKLGIKFRGRG